MKEYKLECADCGVTYATYNKDYIYCEECSTKGPTQEEVDEMMAMIDEISTSLSKVSRKLESSKVKLTPSCKKALLSLTE